MIMFKLIKLTSFVKFSYFKDYMHAALKFSSGIGDHWQSVP